MFTKNTFRYPSSRSSTLRSYALSSNYPERAIVHKEPDPDDQSRARSVVSRSTIHSLKGVENGGRHHSRTSSGLLQRLTNEAPDPDLTSYRTLQEDEDFGFRSRYSSQVCLCQFSVKNFSKQSFGLTDSALKSSHSGKLNCVYSQFGPRRAVSTVTAGTQAPSVVKENHFISGTPENFVLKNFPDLEPNLATRDLRSGLSSRRSSDVISRRSSTSVLRR